MGEEFKQDIVKDIANDNEKKNELKQQLDVNEQDLNNFDFNALDDHIEESFKTFLKENISNRKGTDLESEFNTWLDKNLDKLSELENAEIAQKIVKPIRFELNTLDTLIQMGNIQKELLNSDDLKLHIFSNEVDGNYISNLFQLDFEGREELINYLKLAKDHNGGPDEWIKKVQRYIANVNVDSNRSDHKPEVTAILGQHGVDGKFGKDTAQALEKYISEHLRGKIKLNGDTLTDLAVAKMLVDQNSGELDLSQLRNIGPGVANELASFNGHIDLSNLSSLDEHDLIAFMNANRNVTFPQGELNNGQIKIGGETIDTSNLTTSQLCQKLITAPTNTTNGEPIISDGGNPAGGDLTAPAGNLQNIESQDEGFNYYNDSIERTELKEAQSEKEAIQRLTTSSSNGIERFFGKNGYDEASALVIKNYNAMKNKPEGRNLKKLRTGLESCVSKDGKFNKELLIKALQGKEGELNGDEGLLNIVKLVKDKDEGNLESQPYLKLILGVLDDYFVKGVSKGKRVENIDGIMALYNNELIGKNKDLYERERDLEKTTLDSIKGELNSLEKELGVDDTDALTEEYKGRILAMANVTKLLRTPKANFQKIYEQYKYSEKVGDNRIEKNIFDNENGEGPEKFKFACCLCDINADGKVDVSDMGSKTGQELFNLILDAQIEGQDAMANILNYAVGYAERCGHNNTLAKLQALNSKSTVAEKLNYLADNPIVMEYLREMITKTSIDNTRAIILNGSIDIAEVSKEENDFWTFMMDPNVDAAIAENMDEVWKKIKEELDGNQDLTPEQKQKLLKQLQANPESIKRTLKYSFAGYLALNPQSGAVAGGAVSLGEIFKRDRLNNFSVGTHAGYLDGALFGLGLAYGKRISNESGSFSRDFGAGVGGNISSGGLSFLGLVATGPEFQLNRNALQNTLDVRSAQYLSIHAIGLTNFSVFGGGGEIGRRRDKLAGIEQISQELSVSVFGSLYKAYNSNPEKFLEKNTFIDLVKKQLRTDFPNTDKDAYSNYANLLYIGLCYYTQKEENSKITPAQLGRIFNNLSQDFALNWKNTAIASLEGDVDITGASLGVIYIGKDFIPIASITTTSYGNLFAHDTQESINRHESKLSSEAGMELKYDTISPETVQYLNNKLSIFFPRGKMPQIELRGKNNSNDNVLYIPKELCKFIDISYSEKIQNHIEMDNTGEYFMLPLNMRMGLSTYIGGGTMRANLMLGDNKKSPSDKSLTIDSTFENTNCLNYQPDTERVTLNTVNKINNSLSGFSNYPEFPLSNCERTDGERISFLLPEGKNISIDRNSWDKLQISNGHLLLRTKPSGELKVINREGNFTVSFTPDSNNELKITYDKMNKYSDNLKFDFSDGVLDSLFTDIETQLSVMDNGKPEYSAFMASALDGNYEEAFNKLRSILNFNNSKLKAFKDKFDNANEADQMRIVDRLKAVFSLNNNVINTTGLSNTIRRRGDTYKRLRSYASPDGSDCPFNNAHRDYRANTLTTILNNANNNRIERVPTSNLIGMTAFYRKDNSAQSYMFTELGGTNVLGGVTTNIDQQDLNQTRERFLKNLEKNETYEKTLLESIVNKAEGTWDNGRDHNMIHGKLSSLLKGENVDIGGKFIKINAKFVFYLLGECGNESVGVQIDGIEENSHIETHGVNVDMTGNDVGLYVRTQAAETQLGITANSIPWGITGNVGGGPNSQPGSGGPNSQPGSGGYGNNNTPNNYGP